MSRFYGVLSVGTEDEPERVMRASRVGDDYIQAELCTETHTYRLALFEDGEICLDLIPRRWQEAQDADEDWELLWGNK